MKNFKRKFYLKKNKSHHYQNLQSIGNYLVFIPCFFAFFINTLQAQEEGKTVSSVNVGLSIGSIYKHTPNFKPPINGNTVLAEATYEWQTAGAEAWHKTHLYPIVGVTLAYADFGDPEIFGQAIGVFPSLGFSSRWRNKPFYTFCRVGFGVAYITKPYNSLTNSINNVIGSHINNITDAKAGVGFRLSSQLEVLGGANFTHYSDGSAQLPNLGINVISPFLQVRFSPNNTPKYIEKKAVMSNSRWHGLLQFNFGVRESVALGGPKYAMLIGSGGTMYDLNDKHHLYGLFEYEFNEASYLWVKNNTTFPSDDVATNIGLASRYSLAVGDEFRFGQFGFSVLIGFYLPYSAQPPWFMYEKLGWRYYFLPQKKLQPYLNAHLKAHEITAEYFSFGGGIRF